jgi:digeranylgeranylglycerophospholipid reductase
MKIAIIGGGPAGLLTSYYLAVNGCETTVFEEHTKIGYPKHCTGLVTARSIAKVPIDTKECIEKKFGKLIIHGQGREAFEISIPTVAKIDRVCFEEKIYAEAVNQKTRFRLGARIDTKRKGDEIKLLNVMEDVDFIIDARGFEAAIKNSEKVSKNKLVGINLIIKGKTSIDDNAIHVFFDNKITPSFFAWLVPINEHEVLIGGGFKNSPTQEEIMRYFHRKGFLINHGQIADKYGGVILRGPPISDFHGKNWLAIGDAISMVKPITGGGLYPIISSIPFKYNNGICDEALIRLKTGIRDILEKLRKQYLLSKFIHKRIFSYALDAFIPLIKMVLGVFYLDYDEHDKLISQLIENVAERNVYPA